MDDDMIQTSYYDIESWLDSIKNNNFNSSFLKPFQFVTLGLHLISNNAQQIDINEKLKDYAIRMKLWDTIGLEPPRVINEHSQLGKFIPLTTFNNHVPNRNDLIREITHLILNTASVDTQESLQICLMELINNFYDHAQSPDTLPCLTCAQTWPAGDLIQLAIADSGIGIRNSLSDNILLLDELDNHNACEMASKYEVTSKPNAGHSGYGLTLTKDLMKSISGSYILVSGTEMFISKRFNETPKTMESEWNGTILILEWPIDNSLDVKKIYDDWPNPEGIDDEDFFDD